MRKWILRCISVLLAATLAVGAAICNVYAEETALPTIDSAINSELPEYNAYLKAGANVGAAKEQVSLLSETVTSDGSQDITLSADITQAALYNIRIVWKPQNHGLDIKTGIKINGEYPFDGAEKIILSREWKNSDTARVDAQGNEYSPEQVETGEYITSYLCDNTGVAVEPYQFSMGAGVNTITLIASGQAIDIKEIALCPPEVVGDYKTVSANYNIKDIDTDIITIEGENADIKSTNTIIPKANNSDAGMTPVDPYKTKINCIGGTSWTAVGDYLVWNFEVNESGYYYINLRYKQSDLVNGESLRWLKIDEKTPFSEAKQIRFPYDTAWKHYTFGDDKPYYIYLDKGEHTLSLEATLGEQSEYFYRLSKIVEKLGDEYIKIVMITGETPDLNRDYELFKQIPNFTETVTDCRDGLLGLAKDMKAKSGKDSTQAIAAMENMARVLSNMLRSPYLAQQYVKDYYTNYTSVSSWLYDMTDMPLALDQIQIVPAGKEYEDNNAGFFASLSYKAKRLISSFTADYSLTNNKNLTGESVRLWVNWGQDQTAVLNSLIQDSFTAKTGIDVQLEIVSASLINGILAGNFPDLSLHLPRTEPVNLGIRGALYDLTNFDDYSEVLSRFQKGAETPYRYNNALYALPDTQSFFLMFYRTDIFEQLELKVPETWEEFIEVSTIIQRNNMSVYVPYTQIVASTTVNVGIGSLNLYPTLMSQHGLSFYNKEQNATAFSTKEAIDVFEFWTDFYTDYGFLKEADFYNRMRVGVMPLGIAPYSVYMTLYSAAPEIQGRWAIAPVPGIKNSDGTVNHTVAGAGTGCSIVKKSKNRDAAWEFLKWWTEAETQAAYTNNVESILGMIGRTATANVEAFSSLPWENDDLKILLKQWSDVEEIPEVPGSYYLTRAVDQAYWSVVNGDSRAKDAIVKWSRVADDEIARKIKEYS